MFVINFLIMFVLIYTFYYLFIVKKAIKNRKKQPIEIKYLVNVYKLNLHKINYKDLLNLIAFTTTFVIAVVLILVDIKGNAIKELLLTIIIILPLMFITYHIIGKIYQKRMIKND